jgi:very-short-patch-repair endonuclease
MAYRIIPYNPALKERARQLRKNMTPGEVKLWQRLKGKQLLGYDFDRQRPIDQFIVDFYCKQLMLAIEIDGSSHDSAAAEAHDQERQSPFRVLGGSLSALSRSRHPSEPRRRFVRDREVDYGPSGPVKPAPPYGHPSQEGSFRSPLLGRGLRGGSIWLAG